MSRRVLSDIRLLPCQILDIRLDIPALPDIRTNPNFDDTGGGWDRGNIRQIPPESVFLDEG